jgi:hypothetical protein
MAGLSDFDDEDLFDLHDGLHLLNEQGRYDDALIAAHDALVHEFDHRGHDHAAFEVIEEPDEEPDGEPGAEEEDEEEEVDPNLVTSAAKSIDPVEKGDYPGHPFRGNQYVGGKGRGENRKHFRPAGTRRSRPLNAKRDRRAADQPGGASGAPRKVRPHTPAKRSSKPKASQPKRYRNRNDMDRATAAASMGWATRKSRSGQHFAPDDGFFRKLAKGMVEWLEGNVVEMPGGGVTTMDPPAPPAPVAAGTDETDDLLDLGLTDEELAFLDSLDIDD